MDYISAKDAAVKWGVNLRAVQKYCASGKLTGAKKYGNNWLIPSDASRPADNRRRGTDGMPNYIPSVFISSYIPMPRDNPESVLLTLDADERMQYETELAYLRGDFNKILPYLDTVSPESPVYICACSIVMSAAISVGNYNVYTDAASKLKNIQDLYPNTQEALYAEAALATVAVSIFDPENAPEWLKNCDFSMFPDCSKLWLSYLYAKHLQNLRKYEAMLAAAQVALSLFAQTNGITAAEIYLRLICAAGCYSINNDERCVYYLNSALNIAMPHGFISPFIETVTAYGGLLEKCLARDWNRYHDVIAGQREDLWKNWFSFHNKFTKDNITLILSLQEYQLACQLASGATYKEAAKRLNLSFAAVKKSSSVIYGKLFIKGKGELSPFLL